MRVTIFATFLFFLFLGCENDINEVNRLFSDSETQVETAIDVEMLYSDSAILQLRIVSPKMVRHLDSRNPYQEFPEGLEIDFFSDDGKEVTGQMTARYALRYDNDNKFIVRDSVVWHGGKGEMLHTEQLIWEEEQDRVHTDRFVIVRRPNEIIYGQGFESNQDFTRWRIRAIQGRIKANELTRDLKD